MADSKVSALANATPVAGDLMYLSQTAAGPTDKSVLLSALKTFFNDLSVLNATNLTSGTVPDARFPATLPAISGVNLTALNASNLGSGTVPPARLGTGSGGATKFLREDSTFQSIPGGGDALVANPLSQFASTTSAQLLGVLSDETGTGLAVFNAAPQLIGAEIRSYLDMFVVASNSLNIEGKDATYTTSYGSLKATVATSVSAQWFSDSVRGDAILLATGAILIGTGLSTSTIKINSAGNAVTVTAALTATSFSGTGSSLTALNATQLTSGTVPDARFPATLPAASGVNLTALNATNLGSGTVPTARLGSGTANSGTILYGDQTYKTAPVFVDGVVAFHSVLAPETAAANCAWQKSSINNSNDLAPDTQVLVFRNSGSALISAFADGVPVPANFDGTKTCTVTIVWRTTATTGNVVWNARYRAIADGESNDPSSYQESLSVTAAAPGTARLLKYSSMTMTAANLAAGDTMLWLIGRDKSSGSDTLAADVEVVAVKFEY